MKIYFGPSRPPQITDIYTGFIRRIYAGCRGSNKTLIEVNKNMKNMKYIRTNDGLVCKVVDGKLTHGDIGIKIDLEKVKESGNKIFDNLRDLCDLVVIVWKTGNRWVVSSKASLEDFAWSEIKEVLGSIWVGNRLIPVAKYNMETKEFELIQ